MQVSYLRAFRVAWMVLGEGGDLLGGGLKMTVRVVINEKECRGCGLCILACARDCLRFGDEINDRGCHPILFRDEGCLADALCVTACPVPGALVVVMTAGR